METLQLLEVFRIKFLGDITIVGGISNQVLRSFLIIRIGLNGDITIVGGILNQV